MEFHGSTDKLPAWVDRTRSALHIDVVSIHKLCTNVYNVPYHIVIIQKTIVSNA
jgi:hypothetical protein